MMAEDSLNISNYLEEAILQHTLGLGAYAPVASVYAAILSDISDDGDNAVELVAADYTRAAVAPAAWAATALGITSNNADIVWPAALVDWGVAKAIGIYDSSVGGNLLYWSVLPIAKFIASSAILKILTGSLVITLGGAFSLYLRNAVLDMTLKNTSFAVANIWAGVGTAVSAYNASLSEPAGYSRIQITGFAGGNGFRSIHSPQLSFTASNDWGLITHVGLFDAVSGGNLLYALQLSTPRYIYDGDGIIFEADTIGLGVQ